MVFGNDVDAAAAALYDGGPSLLVRNILFGRTLLLNGQQASQPTSTQLTFVILLNFALVIYASFILIIFSSMGNGVVGVPMFLRYLLCWTIVPSVQLFHQFVYV